MEGIAGVVHESQTDPVDPRATAEYARFRRLMTAESNAAVEGALAAGATKALAGAHGVAVALVSGDAALAAEAKQLLGDAVATVVVKQAVSRHAARSVAPAVACRMIREGVAGALKRKHTPFVVGPPVTIEVDFAMTIHADMAELCPGAVRSGGRTVAYTHHDSDELFRAWRAMLNLSGGVS